MMMEQAGEQPYHFLYFMKMDMITFLCMIGGWYEWLMHDDYPVQVGDPASDECVHTTVGELPTGKAAK